MAIIKRKKPLRQLRQDIKDMYGDDGMKLFKKIRGINPLAVLSYYPELQNAYAERFKKELFMEWANKEGIEVFVQK